MPQDNASLHRNAARISIVGVWTLYIVLIALRTAVISFPHKTALIERHLLTAGLGAALTYGLYLFLNWLPTQKISTKLTVALAASALPAVVLAAANYDIMFVFDPEGLWSASYRASVNIVVIAAQTILENYFIFAGWSMLSVALEAVRREGQASQRAMQSALDAQQAQLRALRYQLDPHFLFNALNTISALVLRGDAGPAERTITALSELLRTTLQLEPFADVTLESELGLQRLYLAIEQIRFGPRLRVAVHMSEGLEHALVPSLLLQPLVENVIRHAVSRVSQPVLLELRMSASAGRLHVTVRDDAAGCSDTPGAGIGLQNVKTRLDLLYGEDACLRHGPRADRGYEVDVTLPLRISAA